MEVATEALAKLVQEVEGFGVFAEEEFFTPVGQGHVIKPIASIIRPVHGRDTPSVIGSDLLGQGVRLKHGLKVMNTAVHEGLTIIALSLKSGHIC